MNKLRFLIALLIFTKTYSQKPPSSEKVFIQTDRESYFPGDTIWMNACVFDARTHHLSNQSKILYAQLIDTLGTTIEKHQFRLINAQSSFFFVLPSFSKINVAYQLVGYTNLMRNGGEKTFFRKDIFVYKNKTPILKQASDTTKVHFFVEGGHLLANAQNKVAFQVSDELGIWKNDSGKVIDEEGVLIVEVKTLINGLGSFAFQPEFGKKYFLIPDSNPTLKFELPPAKIDGYAISLNRVFQTSDLLFRLQSNEKHTESLYLQVLDSDSLIFEQVIKKYGKDLSLLIKKELLPHNKILCFRLLDESRIKINERLYVQYEQADYKLNYEKIINSDSIKIIITDKSGTPVPNISVSCAITDETYNFSPVVSISPAQYLTWSSKLKNIPNNIQSYFGLTGFGQHLVLDNLMLINASDITPFQIDEFGVEKEIVIAGELSRNGKVVSNEKVLANVFSAWGLRTTFVETNEKGYFELGVATDDSLTFTAIDLKARPLRLKLEKTFSASIDRAIFLKNIAFKDDSQYNEIVLKNSNKEKVVALNNVVVKATKIDPMKYDSRRSLYNGEPDNTIMVTQDMRSGATDIGNMLEGRIRGILPGVLGNNAFASSNPMPSFSSSQPNGNTIPTAGSSGTESGASSSQSVGEKVELIIILLDGVRIDRETLRVIPPQIVERVDVLSSVANVSSVVALAGDRKVINILTKRQIEYGNNDFVSYPTKLKGYDKQTNLFVANENATFQPTIYWNTNLRTDDNGEITIPFSTKHVGKKLKLSIQGTDGKGNVVSYSKVITFPSSSK